MTSGPVRAALYEVVCRGPSKCGTFASVRPLESCPKCGSKRIRLREGVPSAKS